MMIEWTFHHLHHHFYHHHLHQSCTQCSLTFKAVSIFSPFFECSLANLLFPVYYQPIVCVTSVWFHSSINISKHSFLILFPSEATNSIHSLLSAPFLLINFCHQPFLKILGLVSSVARISDRNVIPSSACLQERFLNNSFKKFLKPFWGFSLIADPCYGLQFLHCTNQIYWISTGVN